MQEPIRILVSQTARVDVNLQLATVSELVTLTADAGQVDTSTNTLGKTVGGRKVLEPNWRCASSDIGFMPVASIQQL